MANGSNPPFLGLSGSTALTPPGYGASGSSPAGPSDPPSPWQINGPTIYYYNQGGAVLPANVVGGDMGVGSINAQAIYVNGVPVGLAGGGISLAAATGIHLTPNPITASGTIGIDTAYFATQVGAFLPLTGGTLTGTLFGTIGDFASVVIDPGTITTPALNFSSSANTGLWSRGAGIIDISAGGLNVLEFNNSYVLRQGSAGQLAWSSTAPASGLSDLIVARDGANQLAQRNGVAAQSLRVYNTYTDGANFERADMAWASNILTVGSSAAGTGAARLLRLNGGGNLIDLDPATTTTVYRNGTSGATQFQVAGSGLTAASLLHTRLTPTIAQTGTNGYVVLDINPTETTVGTGTKNLIQGRIGAGANVFAVDRLGNVTHTAPPYPDSSLLSPTTSWVTTNFATLVSPTFTGTPKSSTAIIAPNDNNTTLATTGWVKGLGYTTTAAADLAYLKLGGGTLTGPLTGTSATFTTGMTLSGAAATTVLSVPTGTVDVNGKLLAPTVDPSFTTRDVATTAWVRSLFATRGQGAAVYHYLTPFSTAADPLSGNLAIETVTVTPADPAARRIAINKTDADGLLRYLTLFLPGDSLIITDEFVPTTFYARYDITGTVIDNGAWVQMPAVFVGSQGTAPPSGTRVKITGYLNTATGDGPILGLQNGPGLTYYPTGTQGNQGIVGLQVDYTAVAPLANPVFTGNPKSSTAIVAPNDNNTTLATTAWIKGLGYLTATTAGTTYQPLDTTLTALAGLTATAGLIEETSSDVFTKRLIGIAASTSIPTLGDADARYAAISHTHTIANVTGLQTALDAKAPLASPNFTGVPIVVGPTPAAQTSTTQIATCAFVQQEIAADVAGYLPLTGGTLTGALTTTGGNFTIDRTGKAIATALNLRADAGFADTVFFQTGAVSRWSLAKNATAESGSSAGSDFQLTAFSDAGTTLGSVFTVARATRVMDFQVSPTAPTITPSTTSNTQVATTAFVQSVVNGASGNYLPMAGGTLTGGLIAPTLGVGTATAPVGTLQVRGAGQNTGAVSTSLNLGATLTVQDTGAAVNNGGMVMFGASQGYFAAIKGLIGVGTTNTTGDLVVSTRRLVADATLTETARFGFDGKTTLAGAISATAASFTTGSFTGALTYGGVTLSTTPTGTGKMVLDNSPALTGTPTAPTPAVGDADTSIATTAFVATAVAASTPPGVIVDFGGATPPTGWLLCNGAAVSRTTYANLYAALGSATSPYGQGDGTTTFNVPDCRGRVRAGVDTRVTAILPGFTTRGAVGGEAAHVQSIAEIAVHNHSDAGHAHGYQDWGHNHGLNLGAHQHALYPGGTDSSSYAGCGCTGGGNVVLYNGYNISQTDWQNSGDYNSAAGIGINIVGASAAIQNTGSSNAFNVVQPTIAVNAIIKY